MSTAAQAPQPFMPSADGAWPLIGHLPRFYKDPLAFVEANAATGEDLVKINMAGLPHYQLNNPDLIKALLHDYKHFTKGLVGLERRRVFGEGLATSEGDFWLKQRHLIQPAFSRRKLDGYGAIMAEIGHRRIGEWKTGAPIDIHQLWMSVALESVCAVLFHTGVKEQSDVVAEKLEYLLEFFSGSASFLYRFMPAWLMTPKRSEFYKNIDVLDGIIQDMIEQRREQSEPTPDLLTTLLQARDEQHNAMDDKQLRDEMMTLFLAGHETTALALSWTTALLAAHPDIQEALFEQIHAQIGDRPVAVSDLEEIPLLDAVIKESMRMYPPAWILVRKAIEDLPLGKHVIPKGSFVTVSQWAMHHSPQQFSAPNEFRPERWMNGADEQVHKYAYFPFGSGPRSCIGRALSLMEASLFLCTLLQQFRLKQGPAGMPVPKPSLSLRPGDGVEVVLQKRS